MSGNLHINRSQEPEAGSQESGVRKLPRQPGLRDARRNIKHSREVVKVFFPCRGPAEKPPGVPEIGKSLPRYALTTSRDAPMSGTGALGRRILSRRVLSRPPEPRPTTEHRREAGKFSPGRLAPDPRRRSGVVFGYSSNEIFLLLVVLATVETPREELQKKNEAAIRFLLTQLDDFDK
jgi:hypothetical protein